MKFYEAIEVISRRSLVRVQLSPFSERVLTSSGATGLLDCRVHFEKEILSMEEE